MNILNIDADPNNADWIKHIPKIKQNIMKDLKVTRGYRFLYETDPAKIQLIKQSITEDLKNTTLRQFKKFHIRHQYHLFRMYQYLVSH